MMRFLVKGFILASAMLLSRAKETALQPGYYAQILFFVQTKRLSIAPKSQTLFQALIYKKRGYFRFKDFIAQV